MKIIFVNRVLLFCILLLCLVNCSRQKDVNGIIVSELLINVTENYNINYCEILHDAINGNSITIKKLTLIELYDSIAYDHGSVLVDLIYIIGEDKFINSIITINQKEKNLVRGYLDAGLEYGNNPNLINQSLESAFPIIYKFLN